MTQGFMSIPHGSLPVREEMSTSTRKRIKHVHRTPDTALGTLLLMDPAPTLTSGGENTWPCINLVKRSLTSHLRETKTFCQQTPVLL